jgi:predicted dehydrogenase
MSSAAEPLRVGLIGYGLAGSVFHAPLIATTPGLRLAAVTTSNPERRAQAERSNPGVVVYATPDQLLSDPEALDLVVVASPNRSHVALAEAALNAGLPVVVDKPIAGTAEEAQHLIDLAAARELLLSVYQNRRWDGDFLTLRGLIADGSLGRILRYESRFERWRPQVSSGWRDQADPAEVGGLLYDLGSHLVDQALVLFGPVLQVYAEVLTQREGAAVDDDCFVALTHANGVRSHLWMSATAAQVGPRLRVLGDRCGYVKYGLDPQEAALRDGARPVAGQRWGAEPEQSWGRLGTDDESQVIATVDGNYSAYYAGIAAALRNGAPAPVDPHDAVASLTVLEAAARSSLSGQTVTL